MISSVASYFINMFNILQIIYKRLQHIQEQP